ncbi:MAG: BMP family ABC transporter substrate-binding protein [Gammaproteobacteria bacterium]|nr:BMP family ABC transporter substrate-binding protein [Gammaproteobacteria bacterium]
MLKTMAVAFVTALFVSPIGVALAADKSVVLIGNQRFGDLGPMDDMARGLDRCESEHGVAVKKLESISPGRFEEDIRAMAQEGYDLVMTTFPPMTAPTVTVSLDYPEVSFLAIYQFANAGEENFSNVWSTEFRGHEANYVLGALAGQMSTSKRIGYISGTEEPSINGDMNGFIQGVAETCADCSVEFAFAGSWEDPAAGKEIANAMISRGVDYIQTEAAATQIGAIEAAKEGGILIAGDNGDNFDLHTGGFVTWVAASFANNVALGCELLAAGELPVGQHTHMNLANGGVVVPWDPISRFAEANPDRAEQTNAAKAFAQDIEAKIIAGEIEVIYNPDTPKALTR